MWGTRFNNKHNYQTKREICRAIQGQLSLETEKAEQPWAVEKFNTLLHVPPLKFKYSGNGVSGDGYMKILVFFLQLCNNPEIILKYNVKNSHEKTLDWPYWVRYLVSIVGRSDSCVLAWDTGPTSMFGLLSEKAEYFYHRITQHYCIQIVYPTECIRNIWAMTDTFKAMAMILGIKWFD